MSKRRGPTVTSKGVRLHLPASTGDFDQVFLEVDRWLGGSQPFHRDKRGAWNIGIKRPAVDRFEYQLRIRSQGNEWWTTDPTNPRTVPGPWGDKSEIRFPEYVEPDWVGTEFRGQTRQIYVPRALDVDVPIYLASTEGLADDQSAPLIVAHDGSELAHRASLLTWASAAGRPLRVALLDPPSGYRNQWYAANPAYTDHVADTILPAINAQVQTTHTIGLGISLGAVATMAIHRRHPDAFDGLVLQSGSFFTPALDSVESSWPEFRQVCDAVAEWQRADASQVRAVPTLMTCGGVEENRINNERMAGALVFQGYPLWAVRIRDAHTMICWRDAWDPALNRLVEELS